MGSWFSHFSQLFLISKGRYGRLGHGSQDNEMSPRVIDLENQVEETIIACGWSHSIIIKQSGEQQTIYTFGKGDNGQVRKFQ